MLKATLAMMIFGLLSAKIAIHVSCLAITFFGLAEVLYLALYHQHSLPYHFSAFVKLFAIGELCYFVATIMLLEDRSASSNVGSGDR